MYLYIQQELCQKRTLQEWLRTTKERNLLQVVNLFAQTVDAVEYIHLNKLIHRDLKPGNIFLASGIDSQFGSSNKERITVKIGDFGLATTAANRFDTDTHTPAGEVPTTKVNLTGHVGTHLYMSPEQSRNKPYDFKVDIYSLGLIFFELLVPFSTEMERYEALSRVRKMSFPPTFVLEHPDEYEFISKMVSHEPEQRPNATVIKKWLKSHLLSVSPSDSCSPSASRGLVHPKSLSADLGIFPLKKGRVPSDEERVLNKTQSCM
jgi:translation initiation factor 2-alpha kinase 3